MSQKSFLPLLLTVGIGAGLMALASKNQKNPESEAVPTSLDYEDEELKDALRNCDEDEEDEEEDDE